MSTTSIHTFLKVARGLTTGSGIALAIAGQANILGTLVTSGPGTVIHPAAISAPVAIGSMLMPSIGPEQFVSGLALILVGFLFHALLVVGSEQSERAVHITVAPKKKRKEQRWFWIEMSI